MCESITLRLQDISENTGNKNRNRWVVQKQVYKESKQKWIIKKGTAA